MTSSGSSATNSTPGRGCQRGELDRVVDLHLGDVDDDPLGDLGRQRLDGDLAGDVLEHAALLDAGGLLGALQLDRDLGLDLLVELHLLQVEVLKVAADGVELLLLDDDRDRRRPSISRSKSACPAASTVPRVALGDLERRAPPRRRCRRRRGRALAPQAAAGAGAELGPRAARRAFRAGRPSGREDREAPKAFRMADESKIPKGRVRRSAKLGSVMGVQGARYAGTKAANVAPVRGEQPGAARAAPPRDRDEDGRRAGPDEGRGDEARPVRLLHRHRVHPRGVPRDLPGAAGEAAHRRAGDALGEGRQGARGGVRRRAALGAVRRHRAGGVRRRLDRPGAPRRAARRAAGGGEDPVPGDRRGARGRPAQRRHDRAPGPARWPPASTRRRSPRSCASG